MLSTWTHDLRHAFRALAATPAFTLLVASTLGLGIGANAALYTIVDSVLLEPLAFHEPDRLVSIWQRGEKGFRNTVDRETFEAWREGVAGFDDLAATRGAVKSFVGPSGGERLSGLFTTANLFPLLGVRAAQGRVFSEDDDPAVVVLHPDAAGRLFGDPRAAVGRTLKSKDVTYTVVGVVDESFRFPDDGSQFWMPAPSEQLMTRVLVVGRLGAGFEASEVLGRLNVISARINGQDPQQSLARNLSSQILMEPLGREQIEAVEKPLYLIQGAIGLLLLIACANIANLLLVRAGGRRQEMAVRQALGADRWSLFRLLFAESLILSVCGGLVGLASAGLFLRLLLAWVPFDLPRSHNIELDASTLGLAAAATLACALCCGTLPALSRSRPLTDGSVGGQATASLGLQNGFAVAQIALATVLLAGAGLMLRSFHQLSSVDPGFESANRVTFRLSVSASEAYKDEMDRTAFFERLDRRLGSMPGVEGVARASYLPVHQARGLGSQFRVAGHDNSAAPIYMYRLVSPSYLPMMGAPLLRGRHLTDDDHRADGAPGVVINEALADAYWPGWRQHSGERPDGADPIGAAITLGDPDDPLATATVVGVVANMKDIRLDFDAMEVLYVPHGLIGWWPIFTYVIETGVGATSMHPQIRAAVAELDPTLPVFELSTLEQRVAQTISREQASTAVVSAFAALALALAASGVFGTLAYLVSRRRRDIAVRRALGAPDRRLTGMVMRRALAQAVAGLAIGLVGAVALGRWMESLLFGVSGLDPATLGIVAVLLGITALAAGYWPARRALRVEPWQILRSE